MKLAKIVGTWVLIVFSGSPMALVEGWALLQWTEGRYEKAWGLSSTPVASVVAMIGCLAVFGLAATLLVPRVRSMAGSIATALGCALGAVALPTLVVYPLWLAAFPPVLCDPAALAWAPPDQAGAIAFRETVAAWSNPVLMGMGFSACVVVGGLWWFLALVIGRSRDEDRASERRS